MREEVKYRFVRQYEDGRWEIEAENGRRYRSHFYTCAECGTFAPEDQFADRGLLTTLCQGCRHRIAEMERDATNKLLEEKYGAVWAEERRLREVAIALRARKQREMALAVATPSWVDKEKIKAVYAKSREKTKKTGKKHHVDHIWPLQHPICCGLHVHWNLRVVSAKTNISKGNALPEDAWGTGRGRARRDSRAIDSAVQHVVGLFAS
jgi:DNA-directed RNA polymerase subunit RPC12/RpoP